MKPLFVAACADPPPKSLLLRLGLQKKGPPSSLLLLREQHPWICCISAVLPLIRHRQTFLRCLPEMDTHVWVWIFVVCRLIALCCRVRLDHPPTERRRTVVVGRLLLSEDLIFLFPELFSWASMLPPGAPLEPSPFIPLAIPGFKFSRV